MCIRCLRWFLAICCAGAAGVAWCGEGWCGENCPLTIEIESSLVFDDNLLRLPAGTDTVARLGKASAADQRLSNELQLAFTSQLGMQKLEIHAKVGDHRFRSFEFLNYTSSDAGIALRWSVTPDFHGTLALDRTVSLNSFSDYVGLEHRNERIERTRRVDAVYELGGPWQLLAGASRKDQTNQQNLVAGGDHTLDSLYAGVGYRWASGTVVSWRHQDVEAEYVVSTQSDFDQERDELRLQWALPDQLRVDVSMGLVNQTHPARPTGDFDEVDHAASLLWQLGGKSSVLLGHSRSFSGYVTTYSSFAQTDTFYVAPTWQVGPKTTLQLRRDRSRVQYLGDAAIPIALPRQDDKRDTSVVLRWQRDPRLGVSVTLQNSRRGANWPGLDYASTMYSVSAQYQF
ncbi:hypothetical protein [Candidatus Symbiobacter mobilis]|uniref:Uncharacterized protein n=1 Tax=Candidatus Symbiobacter mobilis CR TaxID=946483 RepID=U5N7U6_9BURK|nr:hypothetical protein [Candidatus Symbiobacter mobilis]AGX87462.1 hypothetical protein Cenrod_1375 [Candidatus Symbiobacter mobilis CR]